MAALDFPASPTNGQQFSGPGGVTWVYDLPGTKWVAATLAGGVYAPLVSPGLQGNPTSVTPSLNDNDTSIATTAFVLGQASSTTPVMNGTAAIGSGTTWARADHVHASDTSRLSTAGGTLTGALNISGAAGTARAIYGQTGASNRWLLQLGGAGAESGSNVGSDLSISRWTDAGAFIDSPMLIARNSGLVTFSGRVTPDNIVIGNGGIQGFGTVNGMSLDATNGAFFDHSVCAVSVNRLGGNGAAMNFAQGGAVCGSISVANATSTAYNTSSDGRLKEDPKPFDAGPIVDALAPYDFAWKSTGERAHGVIAQEAAEVFPAAVTHDENADTWGVDYSKFVPLLLAEVKALRARVAALEAEK